MKALYSVCLKSLAQFILLKSLAQFIIPRKTLTNWGNLKEVSDFFPAEFPPLHHRKLRVFFSLNKCT
jgi:hypothetical protein